MLLLDASWPSSLAWATFAVFTVVLVRRVIVDDRRLRNCFGTASHRRDPSIGSLVRNTWFLALVLVVRT